ncbi:von willebrand factor type a [Lucifera butyrica]|uniref:von willebrand factor type a n=1 Tax=Lucifera butyrica TaxID=1351585 RepID=A0A498R4J5_9FIRM|nr:VWA domain-containing protein [Lucifera butyrica]VBB06045.1 von willebrand factor type a [Lucifera butyrica]
MDRNIWSIDVNFLAHVLKPAQQISEYAAQNQGVRIGQSTVASRKVHAFRPEKPEVVQILQHADAGQTFYQRREAGLIFHLDIFHECARIDHHQVAGSIRAAVEMYNFQYKIQNAPLLNCETGVNLDWIDVQTGTGGGRITGTLAYGQKASLRRAHENHVHVATLLPEEHLPCLFFIVQAVEQIVLANHFELRRNEKIEHMADDGNGQLDLSAYADHSDSFLQEKQGGNGSYLGKEQQYRQDVVDLMDNFDTLPDLKEFMDKVAKSASASQLSVYLEGRNGDAARVIEQMNAMGIIEPDPKHPQLSQYGKEFNLYLKYHLPDMEAYLKSVFRRIRPESSQSGRSKWLRKKETGGSGQWILQPLDNTGTKRELTIPDTITAAARRMAVEGTSGHFSIRANDLTYYSRRKKKKNDLCLLVDGSASMAGQRIRAAKFLARHMLLSTPDRVSVIVFQDEWAKIQVPLTRNYREVEDSLRNIVTFGSTPLAKGLTVCLQYLQETVVYNPSIILITDGVPTLGCASQDPLADSLAAAKEIKRAGYGFACIGLKPHKNYLVQLAQAAGGSIYILDELEKQVLVNAAWAEREERCQ